MAATSIPDVIPRAAGPDDASSDEYPGSNTTDPRIHPEPRFTALKNHIDVAPDIGKPSNGCKDQEQKHLQDDELNRILNAPPIVTFESPSSDDQKQRQRHGPIPDQEIVIQGAQPNGDIGSQIDHPAALTVEPGKAHSETLVVIPTHYVFIFSNPRSGNQQGLPLVQMNIQHYRMRDQPHVQVQLYDFLDAEDRSAGLKYLHLIVTKQKSLKQIHVWSAGGDGTLMGVLEGMLDMGIDVNDPRILFSVIPFGTGNDLSQVLGWGRYVPGTDVAGTHLEGLNQLVMARLQGYITLLDIWEVELETEEGGWVEEAGSRDRNSYIKRKMSNYSSLGLQGRVGVGFEKHRRGSRLLNAWEYTKQSLSVLVHGAPHVTNAVRALEAEGMMFELDGDKKLRVSHEPIELIIQNIPGMWGRHVDLWGVTEMSRSIVKDQRGPTDMTHWTPHTAYDGKLEVFGIGTLRSYLHKQFPWGRKHLQRVGQFPSPFTVHFHPHSHVHAMIDGEFYEIHGAKKLTYKRIMQIRMVGSAPEKSRLVRDMVEKRADLPGPTGEGVEPGVDFEVGKTEYGEESKEDKRERRLSENKSRHGTPDGRSRVGSAERPATSEMSERGR
ncbi:diacylglycerol kinase (ATP) [Spizellomyces sp. 'palustris']|nr:diacylglycerol kinase (ATP) [Spizellomyces sp. 'palustris']